MPGGGEPLAPVPAHVRRTHRIESQIGVVGLNQEEDPTPKTHRDQCLPGASLEDRVGCRAVVFHELVEAPATSIGRSAPSIS